MQLTDASEPDSVSSTFHMAGRPVPESGRRWISPEHGHAIERLGHAIEYLADEYALSAIELGRIDSDDPQVEAIHLLMKANREIYYACPRVEPLLRRLGRWALSRPQSRIQEPGKTPA